MDQQIKQLCDHVRQTAYEIHVYHGHGHLEKVYENALAIELAEQDLRFQQQVPLTVYYRGREVGEYYADFLIENRLICELKSVATISRQHEVQLVNYLAATGVDTGLLINFGNSVNIRRKFRIYREPVDREKSF